MHVEKLSDTLDKENIRPRKNLSESEERILLVADSVESRVRHVVYRT